MKTSIILCIVFFVIHSLGFAQDIPLDINCESYDQKTNKFYSALNKQMHFEFQNAAKMALEKAKSEIINSSRLDNDGNIISIYGHPLPSPYKPDEIWIQDLFPNDDPYSKRDDEINFKNLNQLDPYHYLYLRKFILKAEISADILPGAIESIDSFLNKRINTALENLKRAVDSTVTGLQKQNVGHMEDTLKLFNEKFKQYQNLINQENIDLKALDELYKEMQDLLDNILKGLNKVNLDININYFKNTKTFHKTVQIIAGWNNFFKSLGSKTKLLFAATPKSGTPFYAHTLIALDLFMTSLIPADRSVGYEHTYRNCSNIKSFSKNGNIKALLQLNPQDLWKDTKISCLYHTGKKSINGLDVNKRNSKEELHYNMFGCPLVGNGSIFKEPEFLLNLQASYKSDILALLLNSIWEKSTQN
jgi:hypothetical protein